MNITTNRFFNKAKLKLTRIKIFLSEKITNIKIFVSDHPYLVFFLLMSGFFLLVLDYLIICKFITIIEIDQNCKMEAYKILELKNKTVEFNQDLNKIRINQSNEIRNSEFNKIYLKIGQIIITLINIHFLGKEK